MTQRRTRSTSTSPTAALGDFIAETTVDDIPTGARETVIRAITDTVGVTLAGLSHESADIVGSFVTGQEPGAGLPEPGDTDGEIAESALLYGTAGHAFDYDDLSWAMDGHPSVVLLPPLLALTDRERPTGEDVLTAYAVGFETACYVAAPISPRHYEAGWHATATFGTFGATAAASSLLGVDGETAAAALSAAASMPAGLKGNFGSMTKPLHAGLAARSGITAALLAARGLSTGGELLDGPHGFWSLYGGTHDSGPAPPTADGWNLAESGINTKRYPSCYFTHTSIAATRSLVTEHGIHPSDVEAIQVVSSRGAGDALAYDRPRTMLEAKFSMQHAVAAALVDDPVGLESFTPAAVMEDRYRDLWERVEFSVDQSLPYNSHRAEVTIRTDRGSFTETRADPPWTHDSPPTPAELEEKFVDASSLTVSETAARTAFGRLQSLVDDPFETALAPVRP